MQFFHCGTALYRSNVSGRSGTLPLQDTFEVSDPKLIALLLEYTQMTCNELVDDHEQAKMLRMLAWARCIRLKLYKMAEVLH
jgi:hypothetical protein